MTSNAIFLIFLGVICSSKVSAQGFYGQIPPPDPTGFLRRDPVQRIGELPRASGRGLEVLPIDPLRRMGEIPRDPVRRMGEIPRDPVRRMGEIPRDTVRRMDEIPRDPVRRMGEIPRDPLPRRGQIPIDPMRRRGEIPIDPVRRRGEIPRGSMRRRGDFPRGSRPRGVREFAVARRIAAPTATERRTARRLINTLTRAMRPRRRFRGGRMVMACTQYLDFMFVLDSSGSIGASEFDRGLEASKTIVRFLDDAFNCPISPRRSRVGLIEFSSPQKTHLEFSLFEHGNEQAVINAIDSINYDSGASTATGLALNQAKIQFQLGQISGPRYNKKIAWVVTDGNSNEGVSPITVANQLRQMDIMVCAVAVGRNIDMQELTDMADPDCVFEFESFASYSQALRTAVTQSQRRTPTFRDRSPAIRVLPRVPPRRTRLPARGVGASLAPIAARGIDRRRFPPASSFTARPIPPQFMPTGDFPGSPPRSAPRRFFPMT